MASSLDAPSSAEGFDRIVWIEQLRGAGDDELQNELEGL